MLSDLAAVPTVDRLHPPSKSCDWTRSSSGFLPTCDLVQCVADGSVGTMSSFLDASVVVAVVNILVDNVAAYFHIVVAAVVECSQQEMLQDHHHQGYFHWQLSAVVVADSAATPWRDFSRMNPW